jgi:hypothetical protein
MTVARRVLHPVHSLFSWLRATTNLRTPIEGRRSCNDQIESYRGMSTETDFSLASPFAHMPFNNFLSPLALQGSRMGERKIVLDKFILDSPLSVSFSVVDFRKRPRVSENTADSNMTTPFMFVSKIFTETRTDFFSQQFQSTYSRGADIFIRGVNQV